MGSELKEKMSVKDIVENIDKEIESLKKERLALIDKISKGENYSAKDNERNMAIVREIKDLEDQRNSLSTYLDLAGVVESFERLATSKNNKKRLSSDVKNIKEGIKLYNEDVLDNLKINIDNDTLSSYDDVIKYRDRLITKQDILESLNVKDKSVKHALEENSEMLDEIEYYIDNVIDENKLENDISILVDSKADEDKKQEVADEYITILNSYIEGVPEYISGENTRYISKADTEEELEDLEELEEESGITVKKVIGVALAAAAVVGICGLLYSNCSKENVKDNDDPKGNAPEPTSETIETSTPEATAIPEEAEEDKYNEAYAKDYEEAKELFNLSEKDAINYVNRAYKIKDTKFFGDADIFEIIRIDKTLVDKEIMLNNDYTDNAFNVAFNSIIADYFTNSISSETLNRIDGLQYLTKENSDMDKFLTNLGKLTKNVLNNPEDNEQRDYLYKYVRVFAYGLNGFANYKTNDTNFDNNAIVEDYLDYYLAYQEFIKPVMPLINYKSVEKIDGLIIERMIECLAWDDKTEEQNIVELKKIIKEQGYEKNEAEIVRYYQAYSLQNLMETAILGPEFTEHCVKPQVECVDCIEDKGYECSDCKYEVTEETETRRPVADTASKMLTLGGRK